MKTASAAEVKTHFSAYLKASEKGPIVVTKNGKPAAVLVAVADEDELERFLMAHSPKLQAMLDAARNRIQAGHGIPEDEFWESVEADAPKPRKKRSKSA